MFVAGKKPLLLDLFCGGGGAAYGYMQAGFDVVGIDIVKRKNYPGKFIQSDVFNFDFSTIPFVAGHASPPCQQFSATTAQYRLAGKTYPDYVAATRNLLRSFGRPYIIENVPGSPLQNHICLCGLTFGLDVIRHRWFECSFLAFQPAHFPHKNIPDRNKIITVTGNSFATVKQGQLAMGLNHKMTKKEVAQSIPPAYTHYLGTQLMLCL